MAKDALQEIDDHELKRLGDLFEADPERVGMLGIDAAGLHVDLSKTHLERHLLDAFVAAAESSGLFAARDALFAGDIINPTEDRAATHVAERGSGASDAVELASLRRNRVRALSDAVDGGAFGEVESILHIGIGGSVLGPALLVDALGRDAEIDVRFLSNIDGEAFDNAIAGLDPDTTLVIVASKSFTTGETIANLDAAIDWMRESGTVDPYGRLIAVTAAPEAALDAGIDESRILLFDEGVGGRYSLWSAVGVSAALALGWTAFEELLEGAAAMDRHFRYADPLGNAPLLAAFADRLYVRKFGAQSRAVFAYDERLRLLPDYLQQLEMESNGKSVRADGEALDEPSAPVTWGGVGTDAQHAVFQLLHQGTTIVPVEFVLVAEGDNTLAPGHHRQLLLNALAQGAALMTGRSSDDPHRNYPGDRPSMTVLVDRLDARTLGALIAFYEHRTFANAMLIGINPFDQFGVELGKDIARQLSDGDGLDRLDPSTRALIEKAGL